MINLFRSTAFSYPKTDSKQNEDSVLVTKKINDGFILAIADGVGSYEGAYHASSTTIKYLNNLQNFDFIDGEKLFSGLKDNLRKISINNDNYRNAATTLTLAFLNKNKLYIAHIGDCRLYVLIDNKLKCLTKDHTQHQKFLDEKIYTKKELKELNGGNIITSAISEKFLRKYDFFSVPISELIQKDGKISLFLMSDGAHHYWEERPRFSINTMNNILRFSNSLSNRIVNKGLIDDSSFIGAEFIIAENNIV
ncbi:protein phosphatase 2C domain-containing protein [Acinetobacter guillouiae]|uniref:PP2C family protein-serine/threonine phosphatase n=1 Tax=Acinetobacter guillouiae TaxID=106649 RepID=UPI0021D06D7F|nr:protein phosphatase 2C domain-containing protein [Acinetobacter guillouiae]MCU4491678.1 protein phosphatase 2C domain-containing protein [Acinetobacter guillouiae]